MFGFAEFSKCHIPLRQLVSLFVLHSEEPELPLYEYKIPFPIHTVEPELFFVLFLISQITVLYVLSFAPRSILLIFAVYLPISLHEYLFPLLAAD